VKRTPAPHGGGGPPGLVVPVPERVLADVKLRYGLAKAGTAKECRVSYFAITAQRRVTHPAVAALLLNSGKS